MIPMLGLGIALAQRFIPEIIGAFAGDDAEEAAKDAIDIAQRVTGTSTPQAAQAKLEANPELAQQYRLAMLDHDRFRLQLSADERADIRAKTLENIQGARERDLRLRQVTGGENKRADWMVAMAAIGLVSSLAGMIALAYIKAKHPEAISEGVFTALLTQLANLGAFFGLSLRDAFTFEFGSSRGSRNKDEKLVR